MGENGAARGLLGEGEDHEDDYGEHEAEDDDEFDT